MSYSLADIEDAISHPQQTATFCTSLMQSWICHTAQRLATRLSEHGSGPQTGVLIGSVRTAYSTLDRSARARVLLSPWVSSYLEEPLGTAYEAQEGVKVSTLQALHDAMLSEVSDSDRDCRGDVNGRNSPVESALGDWTSMPGAEGVSVTKRPVVADAIVLDMDSPVSRRHEPESGTFCHPRIEILPEERKRVEQKLEDAMALIDGAAPHLGFIVRTFTRRIFIRKTVEAGSRERDLQLGSEYRPLHSGCIRLLNVHREEMTVDLCAEAILHESVHSLLSTYEDLYGKFVSGDIHVRPVSPWSGNFIPNHSLAHAIFVYYTLHLLLSSAVEEQLPMGADAMVRIRRRLMHVISGFMIDRRLSDLFVSDIPPSDAFMVLIDRMQQRVSIACYQRHGMAGQGVGK